MINLKKDVEVVVTQFHIDHGECGNPNKCPVRLATIDAIGKRCYCKVDLTGIALTRRDDYRERAFIPRRAAVFIINYDKDPTSVRPFKFKLHFLKTTPIVSVERKAEVVRKRKEALAKGIRRKHYKPSKRTSGTAISEAGLAG